MKFQMLFVPVAILVSVVWSFYAYGFKGLLVSVGVLKEGTVCRFLLIPSGSFPL